MERKIREQKGITLVALVITIIVMLILVAVSVTVAINGGLFTKAKEAGNEWEDKSAEEAVGNIVKVNVNGIETTMNIDNTINTLKDRPTAQTPAKTITFSLGFSVQFTTTEGTKWAEWIGNDCPVDYFSISDDGEVLVGQNRLTYGANGAQVYGSDPIEDGEEYVEEF